MRYSYVTDPVQRLKQLDERAIHLQAEKRMQLEKAIRSGNPLHFQEVQKYFNGNNNTGGGGRAMLIDPFQKNATNGYYDKRTSISFDTLTKMSRSPIIRAIINTRKEQVADYAHPQPDKYSKGFVIRKKSSGLDDEQDSEQKLSSQEKEEVEGLINFLDNGGDEDNKWHADNFETFLRKMVEDSLSLDQYVYEIVRYRNNDVAEFYAVDASTIRIADTYDEQAVDDPQMQAAMVDGYLPSYVQLYQNRIVAEWYPWEMSFGVRNPQTKIESSAYGRSELEDMIQTVTAMLNADTYNANFFQQGSAPKGMLLVKKAGGINNDTLSEFRSEWQATMAGVDNMHRTPVLDAEHVEWLDLQKSNKDMEFSHYQEYLIKIGCAIYKISPEEVGFPMGGMNRGGLGTARSGNKDEQNYSKEKGLKPILRNIQSNINKYLIGPKSNNKYEFLFVGIDAESEAEEEERLLKATGGPYMEINEARKRRNLQTKPEYDTLAPLLVGGDQQSDSFMDHAMGGEGDDPNEDANPFGQEQGVIKGKDSNPMWDDLEHWWDRVMS